MKTLLASLFFTSTCFGVSNERMLTAIALVESGGNRLAIGDHHLAYGAWQMHRLAWIDGNRWLASQGLPTYPISQWRDPKAQKMVALGYLEGFRRLFKAQGVSDPTPEQIATCWHLGWAGAMRSGFQASDYAQRVSNLAR